MSSSQHQQTNDSNSPSSSLSQLSAAAATATTSTGESGKRKGVPIKVPEAVKIPSQKESEDEAIRQHIDSFGIGEEAQQRSVMPQYAQDKNIEASVERIQRRMGGDAHQRVTFNLDEEDEEEEEPATESPSRSPGKQKPICCIVLGMAGSGKTTLMQRINAYFHAKKQIPYLMNLDPAVTKVFYPPNIDIRDTVKYKNVMKEYGLGPNGAIMTSLNLFSTRFDQVINIVEKRSSQFDYMFVDTPGQIEVFTWSASGSIITETLAATLPTCLIYVVDTPRSANPVTFMSNMLYACSILYKTRLPFIIVFNKTDVVSHEFALEWMHDFEAFHEALDAQRDQSFVNNLTRSMSLLLDEFYNNLRAVGVSAATGEGMDDLLAAIGEAAQEFDEVYLPELQSKVQERKTKAQQEKEENLKRIQKDLGITSGNVSGASASAASGAGSTSAASTGGQRAAHEGHRLGGTSELPIGVSATYPDDR